jgi:hypothetical protein
MCCKENQNVETVMNHVETCYTETVDNSSESVKFVSSACLQDGWFARMDAWLEDLN